MNKNGGLLKNKGKDNKDEQQEIKQTIIIYGTRIYCDYLRWV